MPAILNITIAIIDDHKLIRQMWSQIIEGYNEYKIIDKRGIIRFESCQDRNKTQTAESAHSA